MFEYEVNPDHRYPHQFKFAFTPNYEDFFDSIDWCFNMLTEDANNTRWTYETIGRTILIIEPADALLFWTRWAK
jgi:hypothetical protein